MSHFSSKISLNTSFGWKMSFLLFIVISMIFIGSWISQSGIWIVSDSSDSSEISLENLLVSHQFMGKALVAVNHILIFTVSSVIFLRIFHKNNILSFLQARHFPPSYLILFPLALTALFPVMGYLSQWTESLSLPDFLKNLDDQSMKSLESFLNMNGFTDLIINIIIVGVIAGTGEELLFRGIIQKELMLKMGSPHISIWITAIIFSLLHFQISGFFPKLMIGCVLGYAYYFSQSLLLPILLHIFNNSFATVSLFFIGGQNESSLQSESDISALSAIVSVLVFIWLFNIIAKSRVTQNQHTYE
jgi:membrane protease YdiL (CAAX protease family)